jgi:hypothetical protein
MVGFDEYDRKARLTPGLLLILPIAFDIIAFGLKQYPAVAIAGAMLGGAGATYLLAILIRQLGKKAEIRLWKDWGGPPTTVLLRLRSATTNPILRDSWRRAVETRTGLTLLSEAAEEADSETADNTIEAAVRQLLVYRDNPSYPLVKAELIQYGFERNYYAARWYGRAVALLGVGSLIFGLIDHSLRISGARVLHGGLIAALAINALLLAMWLITPSASRTKSAATRYANQLLQAVVDDVNKSASPTP